MAPSPAILPGAHTDDNNAIVSGHLIETAASTSGAIGLNVNGILANKNTDRLEANIIGASQAQTNGFGGLIVEADAN